MTANEAINILTDHSIEWKIENNNLFAKDEFVNVKKEYGFCWEDISEWTKSHLLEWLGY